MKNKALLRCLVVCGILLSPMIPGPGKGTWGHTLETPLSGSGKGTWGRALAGDYGETRSVNVFAGDYGEARQVPNVKALS